MSLRVDPRSGEVRLVVPRRAALSAALAWAECQTSFVERARARLPTARPLIDGGSVSLGDEVLVIAWQPGAARRVVRDGGRLLVGGPAEAIAGRVGAWLRQQGLARLAEDTDHFARLAGVRVARVAIGDAKGRWGSCAWSGAIRYNWRLVCAPVFVRRAVVAHEVAHRVHMHHGPAFHALVADLYGDVRPANVWLREHGAALHWIGRT